MLPFLPFEGRNGGMVASDKMEDDESNLQEVGPETQISEVEPGIIIPVSPENPHENQYTKTRMMNDAISVGKSLLKSSFGVAGVIFTGIGSVLTTAAKIVGEKMMNLLVITLPTFKTPTFKTMCKF